MNKEVARTAEEIRQQMNSSSEKKASSSANETTEDDRLGDEKGEQENMDSLDLSDIQVPDSTVQFDCEKCEDDGYLQRPNAFQTAEFCECEQGEKRRQEYEQNLWDRIRVPDQFRHESLDSFRTNEIGASVQTAHRMVSVYIDRLEQAISEGKGIYFWGENGTGKTHLLSSILKKAGQTFPLKNRPVYVKAAHFVLSKKPNKGNVFEGPFDPHSDPYETPILFLDELDDITGTAHDFQVLQDLIKSRHTKNKATLIASNTAPERIDEKVAVDSVNLNGVVSRLKAMCKVHQLKGEDKRKTDP